MFYFLNNIWTDSESVWINILIAAIGVMMIALLVIGLKRYSLLTILGNTSFLFFGGVICFEVALSVSMKLYKDNGTNSMASVSTIIFIIEMILFMIGTIVSLSDRKHRKGGLPITICRIAAFVVLTLFIVIILHAFLKVLLIAVALIFLGLFYFNWDRI